MTTERNELLAIFERGLATSIRAREQEFYSKRLIEALSYALFAPGKRLRPLLVMTMALAHRDKIAAPAAVKLALPAAIAVEYIHTYSLVHDDLPAMDDDDYRRGQLSVHRRFDEGLAILAGDALLADAFYHASLVKHNALEIIRELSITSGSLGLVAGQSEDLNRENLEENADVWLKINAAKTARLFEACAVTGAMSVNASKHDITIARDFGRYFGMAFQLKDDVDDNAVLVGKLSNASLKAMLVENLTSAKKLIDHLPHPQMAHDLFHFTFANCG